MRLPKNGISVCAIPNTSIFYYINSIEFFIGLFKGFNLCFPCLHINTWNKVLLFGRHSNLLLPNIYSAAYNHQKWSSCRICCQLFPLSKITSKSLTSNPHTQFALSNPKSQPDTNFAVDMFPYKKTELFQKSGF